MQGLDRPIWRQVQGLVDAGTVNLAFVAEIRYVGFGQYVASPSAICREDGLVGSTRARTQRDARLDDGG